MKNPLPRLKQFWKDLKFRVKYTWRTVYYWNKFKKFVKSRFDRLKCLLAKVLRNCKLATHSPYWVQGGDGPLAYYFAKCRVCRKKLTKDFRYDDENGPFLEGLQKNYWGNRDLEEIIKRALDMFVHNNE